jgi:hypothetical protein
MRLPRWVWWLLPTLIVAGGFMMWQAFDPFSPQEMPVLHGKDGKSADLRLMWGTQPHRGYAACRAEPEGLDRRRDPRGLAGLRGDCCAVEISTPYKNPGIPDRLAHRIVE